jgi:hypothetical protein
LKFTQCRYAPLCSKLTGDVYSFLKSPDNIEIFVRFKFIFTDIPIKSFFEYDRYNGKKQICTAYKQYKNNQDKNGFNLTHNELEIRKFHIKQIFKEIVNMKSLKINYFIIILKERNLTPCLTSRV